MEKVLIVDLEGTLADNRARIPLLEAREYEEYEKASPSDVPNLDIVELVKAWARNYASVIVISSRFEKYRLVTEWWLRDIALSWPDALLMRPEGNWKPEGLMKAELIINYFGSVEEALKKTIAVIDDSDQVCANLKQEGFNVWQRV